MAFAASRLHPVLAQAAHGRQMGEAIAAKTLHPPAFVVHGNERIGAHRLDVGAQFGELLAVLPVAREKNQAARHGVAQARDVHRRQVEAGHIDDHGGMGNRLHVEVSTMTKLTA